MFNKNKKYKMTKKIIIWNGATLHRIKALKNFNNVKKGDIGGYVQYEHNLSQDGDCWLYENSKAYNAASVNGNSRIYDNAEIYENAVINGESLIRNDVKVCGFAHILDNAIISNKCIICGGVIKGTSKLRDNVNVYGSVIIDNSKLYDDCTISGVGKITNCDIYDSANVRSYGHITDTLICDNANIRTNIDIHGGMFGGYALIETANDWLLVRGTGSAHRATNFFRVTSGEVMCKCGCFYGTLDEFKARVIDTHDDSKYAKEYLAVIELAKIYFNIL